MPAETRRQDQVDRVGVTRIGVVVLVAAAAIGGGVPAALIEAVPVRIAVGMATTLILFALAGAARRGTVMGPLRESLLALSVLSIFGWASAAISGLPVVAAWLHSAPIPLAFLAVNAMKLTSVAALVFVAVRSGWSRQRLLVQIGDPMTPVVAFVRWPFVAVPVIVVVGALFLVDLPPGAFGHLPALSSWVPVVLAGAVVNAFAEELLYRHALIATMRRVVGVLPAVLLSSAVFGLAHITGTPGGLEGVLFTSVYGLICAAAMLQARGMVWNVTIHIAGDVAAVSALFLAAA